jgi:hypothetical protein
MNYWTELVMPRWALITVIIATIFSNYMIYLWGFNDGLLRRRK